MLVAKTSLGEINSDLKEVFVLIQAVTAYSYIENFKQNDGET